MAKAWLVALCKAAGESQMAEFYLMELMTACVFSERTGAVVN